MKESMRRRGVWSYAMNVQRLNPLLGAITDIEDLPQQREPALEEEPTERI